MKKYMFLIVFILFLSIILLLPKDIMNKNNKIDYEIIKDNELLYVYYVTDNKVVGVPLDKDGADKYELIELVFKYLTEKSNSVDKKYHTLLNLNTKLLSYELKAKDIYLEVSDNFFDITKEDTIFVLAQILYSYKELGYEEIYIISDGKILSQMGDVVMIDGLFELAVNLDILSTTYQTKKVKITYYYEDGSKMFVNHIINLGENEMEFTLKKLISFVNKEYKTNVELIDFTKSNYFLVVNLSCRQSDIDTVKSLISKNLGVKEENIVINIG